MVQGWAGVTQEVLIFIPDPPHRRQHTEPPAHSHQQHKAEPRTAWGSKEAKARQSKQGEETYYGTRRNQTRLDRMGWDTVPGLESKY